MQAVDFDLIIIGAGPAGSTTARLASQAGWKVLIVDKRQELGAPIQCSGAVSHHALEEVGIVPSAHFVQEAIYGFGIYHSTGVEKRIDYRHLKPDEYGEAPGQQALGYVVDRRRFDRYLLEKALETGARAMLKTEGLGYRCDEDGNATVELKQLNKRLQLRCRCVVAADGLQSQAGKWAGLRTHIRIGELAACLQYIVSDVETHGLLEIITGDAWAPGGYAWVFPKGGGLAEIGLGVTPNHSSLSAEQHLEHFLKRSFLAERFAQAKILEIQGGGVPLAAPLTTQYANCMILVGDAARHVNPITGGGIHTALSGGRIAAQFFNEALSKPEPLSEAVTEKYQSAWLGELGNKMWDLYREKSSIFREEDIEVRDNRLFHTMSAYFSPNSPYKKI